MACSTPLTCRAESHSALSLMDCLKARIRSLASSIVVTIAIVAGYLVLVAADASPPPLVAFLVLSVLGLVVLAGAWSGRK